MNSDFKDFNADELIKAINGVIKFIRKEKSIPHITFQYQIEEEIWKKGYLTNLLRSKEHYSRSSSRVSVNKKRGEALDKIIKKYALTYEITNNEVKFFPSDKENHSEIKILAARLAINLVDSATKEPTPNQKSGTYDDILKSKLALQLIETGEIKRERYIMIIGDQVSHAITKGAIPLSIDVAKRIQAKISEDSKLKDLVNDEIKRLKKFNRIAPKEDNFEIILMACMQYGRKSVIKELQEIYGVKYLNSLTYDIIAHLLKHRLIDMVINFNFDEILDEAIKDEINGGDSHYLYSDSSCPEEVKDFLINERLKKPIYIKPNGTINFKNSLKFTRKDYATGSTKLQETMSNIVSSKVKVEAEGSSAHLPINLIIVGFDMQSPDFIQTIRDFIENCDKPPQSIQPIRLWIIDDKEISYENLKLPIDIKERIEPKNVQHIKVEASQKGFDRKFEELWEEIMKNFTNTIKPKGIAKHQFLHLLFKQDDRENIEKRNKKSDSRSYFQKRFYAELIIVLLKSDGILSLSQIYESGAEVYFDYYKESGTHTILTINKACSDIGLKPYKDFMVNAFIYDNPNIFDSEALFKKLLKQLKDISRRINAPFRLSKDDENKLIKLMQEMKNTHRLKITPKFKKPHRRLFQSVQKDRILHTGIGWIYHFAGYLKKEEEWDLILSVSEQGRTFKTHLKNSPEVFENKMVEVIVASSDIDELYNNSLENIKGLNTLSDSPVFLPWWEHNHHFVLFLKRHKGTTGIRKKDWELKKGFYYKSSNLSRCVNPIYTKNPEDLEILLHIFGAYWFKAKTYTKSLSNENKEKSRIIPIIKGKPHMEKIIKDILGIYDKKKGITD